MTNWAQIVRLDCFTVYEKRIELQLSSEGEVRILPPILDIPRSAACETSFRVGKKYRLVLEEIE